MNGKKLVFISHITEESEMAQILSEQIKSSYLGMLDTFVSSDGESIPAGGRWLDSIDTALNESAIQISLCSPKSIKRPWINFEAGASWIRKIPVIPLCHSGLTKGDLPVPLAMLQAADYNNESDLDAMFSTLSDVLGAAKPSIDYTSFIKKSNEFVVNYTYFNYVKNSVFTMCNAEPSMKKFFLSGQIQSQMFSLQDYLLPSVVPALDYLKSKGLLTYTGAGTTMSAEGTIRRFSITLSNNYLNDIIPKLK